MIKRLALLCCILLLPTIAAAASQAADVNHGEWWIGGQIGGVFTPNEDVTLTGPNGQSVTGSIKTDAGFSAGAIAGYNFCRPYKEVWERYYGAAIDFQWNQFNHPNLKGNQYALSFLGRLQYPLGGSDKFTFGRFVPFLMAGPSIVWTNPASLILAAAARPLPTLGLLLSLAWTFTCGHACPLRRPSVTVMSLGRATRSRISILTPSWTSSWSWVAWPTTSNRRRLS